MSEKTLKFNNIRINKKEFHKSKQPIDLMSVNAEHIVISDKLKHSGKDFKYFIGYLIDEIVKPLCIILPQITVYIKYFENGGKKMSLMVKDDNMLDKYNKIQDNDETYIKVKVREFDGKIKTKFLGDGVTKKSMHYTCIVSITIDSVMKIDKRNYPQVYLEECKYRVKKIQMSRFKG